MKYGGRHANQFCEPAFIKCFDEMGGTSGGKQAVRIWFFVPETALPLVSELSGHAWHWKLYCAAHPGSLGVAEP